MRIFIFLFVLLITGCAQKSDWHYVGKIANDGKCVKIFDTQGNLTFDDCNLDQKFPD